MMHTRNIILSLIALVMISAGSAYYFYSRAGALSDPQQAAQEEAKKWVAVVGKLIVLPADELPIIATVADPKKLQGQPFFQNASKGDKVLIYNTARKAILYNPEESRIVDVAPLSIGTPQPSPATVQ